MDLKCLVDAGAISERSARRLAAAGLDSVERVAEAHPQAISAATGLRATQAASVVAEAKGLVEREAAEKAAASQPDVPVEAEAPAPVAKMTVFDVTGESVPVAIVASTGSVELPAPEVVYGGYGDASCAAPVPIVEKPVDLTPPVAQLIAEVTTLPPAAPPVAPPAPATPAPLAFDPSVADLMREARVTLLDAPPCDAATLATLFSRRPVGPLFGAILDLGNAAILVYNNPNCAGREKGEYPRPRVVYTNAMKSGLGEGSIGQFPAGREGACIAMLLNQENWDLIARLLGK